MAHKRDLNFLARSPNLRYLQAGTLAAVLLSISMGVLVLGSAGNPAAWTATILGEQASEPTESVSASPTPSPRPKALSENPISGAAAGTRSHDVRYFEKQTGRAFSVEASTMKLSTLSDERISGFVSARWVPDTNAAILAIQKPGGVVYQYTDYDAQSTQDLGASLGESAVSDDGSTVAYLHTVGDESSVTLRTLGTTDEQTLLTTRAKELRLAWADSTTLAMTSRRTDRPGSDVSLVAPDGTLRVILSNRENLETQWSPDGSLLLYSYFEPDTGISLWLYVRASGTSLPLGIRTSARKCAWHPSGERVICGVPPQDSLTRDVPADHTATIDDIVSVDVVGGIPTTLSYGVPGTLVGVTDPLMTTSGDYFVFTNMFDGRLYTLPL